MSTLTQVFAETFRSLRVRNFRLFFVGQLISQSGTWMTMIAQTLLVLDLTGSGVLLGVLAACQFGPVLVLGAWAGALADRVDKHRLLLITQAAAMVQSLTMGLIVLGGHATIPVIFTLAGIQGILTAFDNPSRRAFVVEMVPGTHVANAVSLNSTIMTGSRVIGPAVAGVLITAFGYAWCFLIDGASYVAVLAGLLMMRRSELFPARRAPKAPRQVREGLRYVRANRNLFVPIVMMAIIGTLAFNFSVSTPLLVTGPLGGSRQSFTILFSVMSAGSVTAALATARRRTVPPDHMVVAALLFGIGMFALAAAPTLWLAYVVAFVVGLGSVGFMTSSTAFVQLMADPAYRGRVLALQSMVFMGSTPFGGPLIGWVGDTLGARAAVLVGGVACLVAAGWGHAAFKRPQEVAAQPMVSTADLPGSPAA